MKIALRTRQRLGKDRLPGVVTRPKRFRMQLVADGSNQDSNEDGGGGENNTDDGGGWASGAEQGDIDEGGDGVANAEQSNTVDNGGGVPDADQDSMKDGGQGGAAAHTEQLLHEDSRSVSDLQPVAAGGIDEGGQEPCDGDGGSGGSGDAQWRGGWTGQSGAAGGDSLFDRAWSLA